MKQKLLSVITAVVLMASACEIDNSPIKPETKDNTNAMLQYLESMGFKKEDIEDRGDRFVVEGDMVFHKSDHAYLQHAKEEQAYHPNELIFNEKKQTIKVKVHSSVNDFHQEIDKALNMWNQVNLYREAGDPIPESKIKFVKITTGVEDILIEGGKLGFKVGELANASTPVNGNPGRQVSLNLNTKEFPAQLHGHQVAIIAHELGHAIGLQHTNWRELGETGNREVPGTPKSETASLMNQETRKTLQGLGLTQMDRRAVRQLYPKVPHFVHWQPGTLATLSWYGPVHKVKSYTVIYTVRTDDPLIPSKTFTKTVQITGRTGQLAIPFSCRCRSITYTAKVRIDYVDGNSSAYVNSPSLTL